MYAGEKMSSAAIGLKKRNHKQHRNEPQLINFTRILTYTRETLIILPPDLVDFFTTLYGLNLLFRQYSNPTLLVQNEKILFFLKWCFNMYNFKVINSNDEEGISSLNRSRFDLIVLLTPSIPDDVRKYIQASKETVIITQEQSPCSQLANLLARTDKKSLYERYFDQSCCACRIYPDMNEFHVQFPLRERQIIESRNMLKYLDNSGTGKTILIDISTGKSGKKFSDRQISSLIKLINGKVASSILLLDWEQRRYSKLKLKSLIEKPFFLSGENMELLLAHLANTNLIISPNTNFYHIAGLVDTPRIGIFMEDEHPYFFKAPGSNAVFVKKFRSLPYDEITDEIAKLARGKGEKTEERKTEKG
jgi:hypothetical protein